VSRVVELPVRAPDKIWTLAGYRLYWRECFACRRDFALTLPVEGPVLDGLTLDTLCPCWHRHREEVLSSIPGVTGPELSRYLLSARTRRYERFHLRAWRIAPGTRRQRNAGREGNGERQECQPRKARPRVISFGSSVRRTPRSAASGGLMMTRVQDTAAAHAHPWAAPLVRLNLIVGPPTFRVYPAHENKTFSYCAPW
jgi:hypothetical protein